MILLFFAIKKPPKPQTAHVKRQTVKEKISQYINIVRQSYPGNAVCWEQPYIKIKVTEKSYLTISCQEIWTYIGRITWECEKHKWQTISI